MKMKKKHRCSLKQEGCNQTSEDRE